MVKIIKKEVVIDDSLKKKITTICEFCNTKPKIVIKYPSYFMEQIDKNRVKIKSRIKDLISLPY